MDPDNPRREILNTLLPKIRRRVAVSNLRNNELYNKFMEQVTDFRVGTFWGQLIGFLTEINRDDIIARDDNTALLMAIVEPDTTLKGIDADGVLGMYPLHSDRHLINTWRKIY